jgi:hypothetical protein
MFTFRGDAHRFFLKIRRAKSTNAEIGKVSEIEKLTEIVSFYRTLDSSELQIIKYQMFKEQQGSGSIPLIVTTVPWLLFIFSKQLVAFLFANHRLWIPFVFIYIVLLFLGVYLHFHERAWAKVHVEIIEDILSDRVTRA